MRQKQADLEGFFQKVFNEARDLQGTLVEWERDNSVIYFEPFGICRGLCNVCRIAEGNEFDMPESKDFVTELPWKPLEGPMFSFTEKSDT